MTELAKVELAKMSWEEDLGGGGVEEEADVGGVVL